MKFCFALLLALSAAAQTAPNKSAAPAKPAAPVAQAASKPGVPTEQEANEFLRHMFGYDAGLKWQLVRIAPTDTGLTQVVATLTGAQGQQQTFHLYVTPDGKNAVSGEMVPFGADPFAPARALLRQANGPARGPADAPLLVVEFGDLQCPSCKQAQPIVDKLLADNPNARFVFQQFPLTAIHDWAMKGAAWSDCIGRQNNDAFWKFVAATYEAQANISAATADAKLKEIAVSSGANADAAAQCAAAPETKARVEASMKLGEQLDVGGTPTFFFNGRKIANVSAVPYEVLGSIVKFQATLPKN